MNIQFVDLAAQYNAIQQEIDSAIQNCLNSTQFIGGEEVTRFEEAFAHYMGYPTALAVQMVQIHWK